MTVLFITHYSGFYGANRSLIQLMIELRRMYDVSPIVLIPSKGRFVEHLERVCEFRCQKPGK